MHLSVMNHHGARRNYFSKLDDFPMDDRYCNHRSYRRNDQQSENRGFFRKPRIKINHKLIRHQVRISVCGRTSERQLERELFNGIVWNIEVSNKCPLLRHSIDGCLIQLNINNLDVPVGLMWKRNNRDIPTAYNSGIGLTEEDDFRHEYQRRLGSEYNGALTSISTGTSNIVGKQKRELFFIITFADLDSAFIITSDGSDGWRDNDTLYKHIDGTYLILPVPSDTEICLSFGEKDHRCILKIVAHDNVQLVKHHW